MKRVLTLCIFCLSASFCLFAENVELTVSATGSSRDIAISNALRNAIEQTYGVFVSSNTAVLNDELMKDQTVTLSSGIVKTYSVVSESVLHNGHYMVNIKACVSTSELVEVARNLGSKCELAGSLIATNIKMERLYEKNEVAVMQNLFQTIDLMQDVFDYKLKVENASVRGVSVTVSIYANKNMQTLNEMIFNTLSAIGLSKDAVRARKEMGLRVFENRFYYKNEEGSYVVVCTRNKYSNDGLEEVIAEMISKKLNNYSVNSNISYLPFAGEVGTTGNVAARISEYDHRYPFQYGRPAVVYGYPNLRRERGYVYLKTPSNLKFDLLTSQHYLPSGECKFRYPKKLLVGTVSWWYDVNEAQLQDLTDIYIDDLP